jgi:hypothetical protein
MLSSQLKFLESPVISPDAVIVKLDIDFIIYFDVLASLLNRQSLLVLLVLRLLDRLAGLRVGVLESH